MKLFIFVLALFISVTSCGTYNHTRDGHTNEISNITRIDTVKKSITKTRKDSMSAERMRKATRNLEVK
jgi:hypothetical protein